MCVYPMVRAVSGTVAVEGAREYRAAQFRMSLSQKAVLIVVASMGFALGGIQAQQDSTPAPSKASHRSASKRHSKHGRKVEEKEKPPVAEPAATAPSAGADKPADAGEPPASTPAPPASPSPSPGAVSATINGSPDAPPPKPPASDEAASPSPAPAEPAEPTSLPTVPMPANGAGGAPKPGEDLPVIPGDVSQQMQLIPPGIVTLPAPALGPSNLVMNPAMAAPTVPSGPYAVSKFVVKYYPPGQVPHKGLPSAQGLLDLPVKLGVKKGVGYFAPGKGDADQMVIVSHIVNRAIFAPEALQAIYTSVAKQLNNRGIYGVFVTADEQQLHDADLSPASEPAPEPAPAPKGEKAKSKGARHPEKVSELTLIVYASEVKQIRTVSKPAGKQIFGMDLSKVFRTGVSGIDEPRYKMIAAHSPLTPPAGDLRGSLLQKDALQEYLDRINRFPGRRVDVAITASGVAAGVILDYIIHEERPSFFAFNQISNTGTKASGEWRDRVGMEVRELAHHDDILDASFETSLTQDTYSGFGSYQFTPIFPDLLKLKIYGGYGLFSADDVGFQGANFEGHSATAAAVATYTPVYVRGFPIDFTAGVEWRNVDVTNKGAFPEDGETSFVLPIVGVSTDKATDRYSLFASVQIQPNIASLADTNAGELQKMGRGNVDKDFVIGRYSLGASFYLEPLIHFSEWQQRKDWWISTLANEISMQVHGQFTLDDRRLVPQFEDVVGGFDTVRGYPESYAAGDTSLVFNGEYRFHISRALKPLVLPGDRDPAPRPKFTFRPPGILDQPDLDVMLRTFFDLGYVHNNNTSGLESLEEDRTLASVGLGVEVAAYRNLDLRLDLGFPLLGVLDKTVQPVTVGSSRFSFVGVLSF